MFQQRHGPRTLSTCNLFGVTFLLLIAAGSYDVSADLNSEFVKGKSELLQIASHEPCIPAKPAGIRLYDRTIVETRSTGRSMPLNHPLSLCSIAFSKIRRWNRKEWF